MGDTCDGWEICLNKVTVPENAAEVLCDFRVPEEVLANTSMGYLVLHRTMRSPTTIGSGPLFLLFAEANRQFPRTACSFAAEQLLEAGGSRSGRSLRDHAAQPRIIASSRAVKSRAPFGGEWSRDMMTVDLDELSGQSIYLRAKYEGPASDRTSYDAWLVLKFF